MRIEYTATRNLASGHTTENQYELAVFAEVLTRRHRPVVQRNVSLDRSRVEIDLAGYDRIYSVTTDHIPIGQETDEFEEFLQSVELGEQFVFDPDSDATGDVVNPMNAMMESDGYEPDRALPGYFRYSFTVRVL